MIDYCETILETWTREELEKERGKWKENGMINTRGEYVYSHNGNSLDVNLSLENVNV